MLINNSNYIIILEIIPFSNFIFNQFNNNKNISLDDHIKYNYLKMFIKFMRDIGLNNKIVTISPLSYYQNFEEDNLFIENLHTIKIEPIDNIKWIPLLSRFFKNHKNNYFS